MHYFVKVVEAAFLLAPVLALASDDLADPGKRGKRATYLDNDMGKQLTWL
jgi:hypothetical protein